MGLSESSLTTITTVNFHNFKSQNFKLSVSNPKNKFVAYLSVLSQISNCQGLGRKNKFEILKTDRKTFSFLSHCEISCDSPCCQSLCGDNDHCIFNIDTHEYISDSDEYIGKTTHTNDTPKKLKYPQVADIFQVLITDSIP